MFGSQDTSTVYSASGVDVHTNGTTSAINVPASVGTLEIFVHLLTLTGGTSPSITFTLNFLFPDGTNVPFGEASLPAFTTIGGNIATIGVANGGNPSIPTPQVTISWTVSGAPTGASANFVILGR